MTGKALLFLSDADVALLAWTLPPLLLLLLAFTGPFAAAAFDRDHARAAGHPVVRLEAGFALGLLALVSLAAPRAGACRRRDPAGELAPRRRRRRRA